MTIRQLEYFCATAEEGSVSAAARKLHVAQPPSSKRSSARPSFAGGTRA